MQILRRFTAFLNIHSGEERLIGLLFLLALVLELAFVLIESMAFGVFIAEYGPQSLPYSYIVIAIFASLAAVLYIKLGEKVPFSTALILSLAFLGALTVLVWLGLKSNVSHSVSFILPLLFQIVLNLGNLVIWQLAGRLFNLQQAKRLFPLISTGTWLANILGGLLVLPLVNWMGANNLLIPSTLIIALAICILHTITRNYPIQETATPKPRRTTNEVKRSRADLQNRYVLLIIAFLTFWWMAFFFLDNIFADLAAIQLPNVNQLIVFRGQLLSITGMVALITSTFLTSRVIGRFGVQAGLLSEALPVTLILGLLVISGSLGGTMAVALALAALAKLLNVALGFSVSLAAYVMLYQPLPHSVRGRAQATAEGIFQPIASGLAGICLLALTTVWKFDYLGLSYVYLVLGTVLLIVILLLSRSYVGALTQAITKRRLGESTTIVADPASIALLRSRLHDPHPGVAVYALTKLEAFDEETVFMELPSLIQHPAPEVRREAFNRVEKLKRRAMLNEVQNQLSVESNPSVKESALRALGAMRNRESFSPLMVALNETDVHSLRGALVGLLKYGNESAAEQKLNALLASPANPDRILAIEVLGEVNRREFYPHLIRACDSPATSRAAVLALAAMGADILPDLEIAFSQSEAPHQRLLTLARTLGRIGGAASHNILLSRMDTPDEEMRSQILNALSQSGFHTKDISEIQRAIKAEVEQAAWYCAAQVDLGDGTESALLVTALQESLEQIRNRVLLLLSFVFDGDSIRRAREAFLFGSASQLSYALEIMDTQLPSEWKGWVMPFLEELSPQARSQRFAAFLPQAQAQQTPEERLCAILEKDHFSFWVRACTEYTYARLFPAARKGDPAMLSTVEKVLTLKTVSMFSQTPYEVLADVANLLEEVEVAGEETIFKKGDPGNSMYIIVDGKVRVHTEERLLNYLGESDVFGEMALLDPEPRLASITAVEPTRLFRLDQASFYQLMAERAEVATGIIRVLTRLLRDRVRDLSQLQVRIKELEQTPKQEEPASI